MRPKRRRTGQLSGLQVMFAAILAIGLILGLNFTSLISAGRPLQELYDSVSEEIEQLEQEQAELLVERDYARSDTYVESWARDEGKMVRPGDVLVIPVPSGVIMEATAEPTPAIDVETTPPEPESWTLWWRLFFDTPPPRF
jgi:cell division protein FtsB